MAAGPCGVFTGGGVDPGFGPKRLAGSNDSDHPPQVASLRTKVLRQQIEDAILGRERIVARIRQIIDGAIREKWLSKHQSPDPIRHGPVESQIVRMSHPARQAIPGRTLLRKPLG